MGLLRPCPLLINLASDRAGFAIGGEAHNQRPDEHPDVDFSTTERPGDRAQGLQSSVRETAKQDRMDRF